MDFNRISFLFNHIEIFINNTLAFFFADNTGCFLSFLYIHQPVERLHEKKSKRLMCIIAYYYESCQFTLRKKIIFYISNYALMLYDWYSPYKLGPKQAMCSTTRIDKILIQRTELVQSSQGTSEELHMNYFEKSHWSTSSLPNNLISKTKYLGIKPITVLFQFLVTINLKYFPLYDILYALYCT